MEYSKHYNLLIERARTRVPPEGYIERHHVIPRCLGGSDDESNLVALTPEEHYLAHLLLVKIHPENRSLVYAANKMTVSSKDVPRNNKRYGWIKRRYSEVRREDSKGAGNTQYGTIWINKVGTTENKKISKDEPIPDGWQRGRKINKDKKCKICSGPTVSKRSKFCKNHYMNNFNSQKENLKSAVSSRRKATDLEIEDALVCNDFSIDRTMLHLGYKVSYGNTRNRITKIAGKLMESPRPSKP